jgi:hypothetical protein
MYIYILDALRYEHHGGLGLRCGCARPGVTRSCAWPAPNTGSPRQRAAFACLAVSCWAFTSMLVPHKKRHEYRLYKLAKALVPGLAVALFRCSNALQAAELTLSPRCWGTVRVSPHNEDHRSIKRSRTHPSSTPFSPVRLIEGRVGLGRAD